MRRLFLGRAEVVRHLLDKGADTTLRNNMGGMPIEGAEIGLGPLPKVLSVCWQIEVDEGSGESRQSRSYKAARRKK